MQLNHHFVIFAFKVLLSSRRNIIEAPITMPLPKYFCDYCDRSFNDIPSARKKHFESKYHKMMVKLHYDSYKDPAELLAEEARKPPCRNLQITGKCEFGPNCRFSHVFQHFPGLPMSSLGEANGLAESLKSQFGLRLPGNENLPPSMIPAPQGGYRLSEAELGTWG